MFCFESPVALFNIRPRPKHLWASCGHQGRRIQYIQNRLIMYSSLEKVEYIIWHCQVTRLHSRMTWLLDQHSFSSTSIFVSPVAPEILSASLEKSRQNRLIHSTLLIVLLLEVSLLCYFLIYDRVFQTVLVPVLGIIPLSFKMSSSGLHYGVRRED
jgi:hypothetical protein